MAGVGAPLSGPPPPAFLADEAATERAGGAFAAVLAPGDVVLLSGPLGAGKTAFVRGAVAALGAEGPVQSPTFVVGRTYAPARPGGVTVHHLDLYRLGDALDPDDLITIEPYLEADAVTFVEWPEAALAAGGLPAGAPRAHVHLDHPPDGGPAGRTLRIELHGDARA